MSEFRWYLDDTICHNCHNHCSLLEPSCNVGKRAAKRKRQQNAKTQDQKPRSNKGRCD